jgi:hypothetical protein
MRRSHRSVLNLVAWEDVAQVNQTFIVKAENSQALQTGIISQNNCEYGI